MFEENASNIIISRFISIIVIIIIIIIAIMQYVSSKEDFEHSNIALDFDNCFQYITGSKIKI